MNVSDPDDSPGQEQEPGGLSAVGRQLARARGEKKLEIDSVASDLHLRVEVVQALEAGDEGRLPALAYVRGYVRSYARLLGLNESELTAQLPEFQSHQPMPLKTGRRRGTRMALPAGKWLGWMLGLVVLVLFAVYGVPALERLWSSRSVEPDTGRLELPAQGLDRYPGQNGQPLAVPETELEPEIEPEQEPVEIPRSVEEAVEPPAGISQPQPTDDAEVESGTAAFEEPEPPPQAAENLLLMRFREDSWVEVDSDGRKLLVGIQRAGAERVLKSAAPISVLLGNAPGVDLIHNGEPVDTGPFQRGKVARLVLEN